MTFGNLLVCASWYSPLCILAGESVASCEAVTERVCSVPVRPGGDPAAGCNGRRALGKHFKLQYVLLIESILNCS